MASTSASKDELTVDISHFTSVLVRLTIISLYAFLDNPPTWKENVRPQQYSDSDLPQLWFKKNGIAIQLLPSSDGSDITSHYNCLLRLDRDVFALANSPGRTWQSLIQMPFYERHQLIL